MKKSISHYLKDAIEAIKDGEYHYAVHQLEEAQKVTDELFELIT